MKRLSKLSKKKKIIAGIALALAVVILVPVIKGNAAVKVEAVKATRGELERSIEINGTVKTNESKTYYAQIDGQVGHIVTSVGETVNAGDVLIEWDSEKLDYDIQMADYSAQSELGAYNNSIQNGGKMAGLYSEANTNLKVLDQQITDTSAAITSIEKQIEDKKAGLAAEGANLQISLIDWADKPDSEEYENLQKLVQSNAYEQQYNSDLVAMQDELNRLNKQLAACKEYKAEMSGQKSSSYTGVLTSGAKEQLEAQKASSELKSEKLKQKLEAAKGGVKADFSGVVTRVSAVEGSSVGVGAELIKIDSNTNIIITSHVNKYDIEHMEEGQQATVTIKGKEYTGKISKLSKVVTVDDKGVAGNDIEIVLDAPDSDIILGADAKANIITAKMDNVVQVPMETIISGTEGEYVYVIEKNVLVKRPVKVGASGEYMVEITEGLNGDEQIAIVGETELTEGMEVTAQEKEQTE